MATSNSTALPDHERIEDIRDIFQGIEASAKLLSLHVIRPGDLDTDLVAAVMVIAREADHGAIMACEIMESQKGGAS